MVQCGAVVAGPRELDLAGHGGWWKEGEEREVARQRGSGATYRPESTWAKGVAYGRSIWSGATRPRAGGASSGAAHGGAMWRLGRAQGRVSSWGGAKGQARWRWRAPLGPHGRGRAVDEVHRRRTAGGRRNRAAERGEMEVRAYL